jgi:tyrosine-protein phosphatase SIW14
VGAFSRWIPAILIAALVTIVPVARYRAVFDHSRRLRVVEQGVLYRSGCMTREGFVDAVRDLKIKSIINLQDEFPDPALRESFFDTSTSSEVELCNRLGVRYFFLPPDLIPRPRMDRERPQAIDKFLEIMDNPDNYPVLVHCKAGLHRTGVMVAVYRMEYQGWPPELALREAKANGWLDFLSSTSNLYIEQYVTSYHARAARPQVGAAGN